MMPHGIEICVAKGAAAVFKHDLVRIKGKFSVFYGYFKRFVTPDNAPFV